MINQRHCPFCKAPATDACEHLAVAAEGRDFVSRCIELCAGHEAWQRLCRQRREVNRSLGGPEQEDFMWLETAFCEHFLKGLAWFGGMDYEWRSGSKLDQGGFWVLAWSRDPRRLWWELRDELERKSVAFVPPETPAPWLIWLTPR